MTPTERPHEPGSSGDPSRDAPPTRRLVVTVCTGNLCRSPMAEVLLVTALADRGVVDVDVLSAGTDAFDGAPVMPETMTVIDEWLAELDATEPRADGPRPRPEALLATPLDVVTARDAHLLLCASERHRRRIRAWWPDVEARRIRLFNEPLEERATSDVADPMGLDVDVFRRTARVIGRAMDAWAEWLVDDRWLD